LFLLLLLFLLFPLFLLFLLFDESFEPKTRLFQHKYHHLLMSEKSVNIYLIGWSMHQYINTSIHQCINTSMHQCKNGKMEKCNNYEWMNGDWTKQVSLSTFVKFLRTMWMFWHCFI
jgi:hypothetical protein